MEIFNAPKRWDKKKPTSDMNDDDFQAWEREKQARCADDGDFWLNKRRIRPLGPTRKRIWPPPEKEDR